MPRRFFALVADFYWRAATWQTLPPKSLSGADFGGKGFAKFDLLALYAVHLLAVCSMNLLTNPEAEQAVAGGVLFGGARALQVVRWVSLTADDFSLPACAAILRAAEQVDASGAPIDVVTVAAQLRVTGKMGFLQPLGAEGYLGELANRVATVENIAHHCGLVVEAAQRRVWLADAGALQLAAKTGDLPRALDQVQLRLQETAQRRRQRAVPALAFADLYESAAPEVLPTSLEPLNRALGGGWQTHSYVVLNGGTKHGKSSFALLEARHQSAQGVPTLVVSVEMRRREVLSRMASQRLPVVWQEVDRRWWRKEREPELQEALAQLANLEVLEFKRGMRLQDLLGEVKRLADRTGRRPFVVLDYLQRILSRTEEAKADPRLAQGQLSDTLAEATRDLGATFLVLSAIPRHFYGAAVEEMSDDELNSASKEGGGVEYDAGAVLFLRKHHSRAPDGRYRASLRITAQRFAGGTGEPIRLLFDGGHNLFAPDAEDEDDPLPKAILAVLKKPVNRSGLSRSALAQEIRAAGIKRRNGVLLTVLGEMLQDGAIWRGGTGKQTIYRHADYAPTGAQMDLQAPAPASAR